MKPPLLVMIVGILSPIAQQLLFVLLKRRSSAHFPLFRLRPRNEWTYKSNATLYNGPQVGSVAIRLLWIAGDPTEIQRGLIAHSQTELRKHNSTCVFVEEVPN